VKAIGPDSFKAVACAYLRERFARPVQFVDGTGDGGVDAWIVKSDDPLVRHAAQFYAGDRNGWQSKLGNDVTKVANFRSSIQSDVTRQLDFARFFFVCALEPSATAFINYADDVFDKHGIRIELCDARMIASQALQNRRGPLFALIAGQLHGASGAYSGYGPALSAREKALLSFAVFDERTKHVRRAVAKDAVMAAASTHHDGCLRTTLESEACRLLALSSPSRLVTHAVRDLLSEGQLSAEESDEQRIHVKDEALLSWKTATAVARAERDKLRERCIALVEPKISRGRHHNREIASRAVDALIGNLGALVREAVAERLIVSLEPGAAPRDASERRAIERWKRTADELARELDEGPACKLLLLIVNEVAKDTFVRRLAAAELSFRLTEFDAQEFEQAINASNQRILLDASIAIPMLCARFDGVIDSWTTSVAAHELYAVAQQRGAKLHVASAHLEEMAAHLYQAKHFAPIFDEKDTPDLRRSRNYYVAHFASSQTQQSRQEFERFLASLGLTQARANKPLDAVRQDIERALSTHLHQYAIERRSTESVDDSKPLWGEPAERDLRLLRHDRAVVNSLELWSRDEPWLVCTADRWLRDVLNEMDILAVDSVGLTDLLSLVQPTATARPVMSALELALSVGEDETQLASSVWDTIVLLDAPKLSDRRFYERAREFRDAWFAARLSADDDIGEAWKTFRDTGALPPSATERA
jgi:hypothetical protein